MRYQQYEQLVESARQWLHLAPVGWRDAPFGHLFCEIDDRRGNRDDLPLLSVSISRGVVPRSELNDGKESRAEDLSRYKICRTGDIALNRMRAFQGGLGIVRSAGVVSPDYMVLRVADTSSAEYVTYLMKSIWFVNMMITRLRGVGTTEQGNARTPRINPSDLARIVVAVPPRKTQIEIADVLNRQTAQIDELIGRQKTLITLLGERRRAVIARAVTKGLDPTKPMKDSRVEWLGKVPAHWTTTTLKHRFTVVLGKMLDAGRSVRDDDEEMPYLRAANIQDHGLALDDVKRMPFTARERRALRISAGDLLVVEGGAVGTNYAVPSDMDGWFFQKTINRVRPIRGDSTILLGHLIRVYRDDGVIDMICNKSTIAHLTAEKLEVLPIVLPPLSEQLQIVRHLAKQTSNIDVLIQKASTAVALLSERRSALITAAVTGKIDVRGEA